MDSQENSTVQYSEVNARGVRQPAAVRDRHRRAAMYDLNLIKQEEQERYVTIRAVRHVAVRQSYRHLRGRAEGKQWGFWL